MLFLKSLWDQNRFFNKKTLLFIIYYSLFAIHYLLFVICYLLFVKVNTLYKEIHEWTVNV